jgi:uncharacterized membrane protein YhaH (DUF805 family)
VISPAPGPPLDPSAATPPPLTVAASLVAVEGVVLVLNALLEAASTSLERFALGATTTVFFALYGAALLWCARSLHRRRPGGRGFAVMTQLLLLLVSTSFFGGGTTWFAVLAVLVAAVTLAGILHPASMAALADDPRT